VEHARHAPAPITMHHLPCRVVIGGSPRLFSVADLPCKTQRPGDRAAAAGPGTSPGSARTFWSGARGASSIGACACVIFIFSQSPGTCRRDRVLWPAVAADPGGRGGVAAVAFASEYLMHRSRFQRKGDAGSVRSSLVRCCRSVRARGWVAT
jgi:hypothetical protein